MAVIDDCKKVSAGFFKPTKRYCKNNCKEKDCKHIGNRHKNK